MDQLFIAQYPPERMILDNLMEISRTTLDQVLGKVLQQLEDLHPNDSSIPSYAELVTTIRANLSKEPDLATLFAGWEKELALKQHKISEKNKEANKLENKSTREKRKAQLEAQKSKLNFIHSIKYASLYAEIARKKKSENSIDQAWAYACKASYCCGEISANSIIELGTLTTEKTKKQNSSNSKEINKKTGRLKEYIATLIREHTPQDGWPTETDAISAVVELKTIIGKFIKDHDIRRVTVSNIENLLLQQWINKPGAIQEALKETVRLPQKKGKGQSSAP